MVNVKCWLRCAAIVYHLSKTLKTVLNEIIKITATKIRNNETAKTDADGDECTDDDETKNRNKRTNTFLLCSHGWQIHYSVFWVVCVSEWASKRARERCIHSTVSLLHWHWHSTMLLPAHFAIFAAKRKHRDITTTKKKHKNTRLLSLGARTAHQRRIVCFSLVDFGFGFISRVYSSMYARLRPEWTCASSNCIYPKLKWMQSDETPHTLKMQATRPLSMHLSIYWQHKRTRTRTHILADRVGCKENAWIRTQKKS